MATYKVLLTIPTIVLLSSCGGGSSSSAPASVAPIPPVSLSANQTAYESVVLSANGGAHYLSANVSATATTSGVITMTAGDFFVSENLSVSQSPSTGPQPVSAVFANVSNTLALPTFSNNSRYMVNGNVLSQNDPPQSQVTYSGENVLETYFASDGQTPTHALLTTNYTVVPLSGLISASPGELFDSALVYIEMPLNGGYLYKQAATWQADSSYAKVVRQYVGDTFFVTDCYPPNTTGTSMTPCPATSPSLENFFPFVASNDGVTYQYSDGQVQTLGGVSAWVANAALNTVTTEYRVFYLNNGAIYAGSLIKSGTTLNGGTNQNFYIYVNDNALKSITAALNF